MRQAMVRLVAINGDYCFRIAGNTKTFTGEPVESFSEAFRAVLDQ